MKLRVILLCSIVLALALSLWTASAALACDPWDDESSVGVSVVACRWAKPPQRVAQSPAPGVTTGTTAPSGTNSASVPADTSQPLSCLLPFGDTLANALGVTIGCSVPPTPQRVAKAPVPTPVPTSLKSGVSSAPLPKGDSPFSAMPIADTWQTLGPGEMAWYKIDNGNNFYLDVWLDAYGKGGMSLAIYSPEQANQLSPDTPPKGRGTPAKNEPTHDLYWKGSSATGTWYALVTNYNSVPVQYKLGSAQTSKDRKCITYWECFPTNGTCGWWTDCGHYTDVDK